MSASLVGPISRVMLFGKDARALAEFYRDKLGLEVRGEISDGWAELITGSCDIVIHGGAGRMASERGPCNAKLVFACARVEEAKRELEVMGVKMGEVDSFKHETRDVWIQICDGADPEGNWFQLSNRNLV